MPQHELAELLDKTMTANRRATNQALHQLAQHMTVEQITELTTATENLQADAYIEL